MAKLFPHLLITDFLPTALNKEILAYAIDRKLDFQESKIQKAGQTLVSNTRISMTLYDLGPFKNPIEENIRKAIPTLVKALKIPDFPVGTVELQLAAHGDGARFISHIDTRVHHVSDTPRVISAVYYLHSEPRKFEGGLLRLHTIPLGDDDVQPLDISPDNNSLLAFPSIAPHEVLEVIAPGVEFQDWRFAVNCWIHRAKMDL
jgi:SM-20-related protein